MFNFGNPLAMLSKLQDLPEKIRALTERMRSETVSATSPCGTVTVVMNGTGEIQSISIADGQSGQELERSVLDATNAAGAAAKQLYADGIANMISEMNLNIPGIDGILTSLVGGR